MTMSHGGVCDYADPTEYCSAATKFAIITGEWGWGYYCTRHHHTMTDSAITALESLALSTD